MADLLTIEERKLFYLNLTARVMSQDERDKIDAEYSDVIDFMMGRGNHAAPVASAPKPGSKAQANLASFITDHGALRIAIACLPALNDQEFSELALAAEKVYSERNPGRTLGDVEQSTQNSLNSFGDKKDEPTSFVAEQAGAYEQPDGTVVKFATGDTIHEDAEHRITVVSYIPEEWATLKPAQLIALAKKLGADATVKSKDDASAFIQLQVEARAAEIAAVADPTGD